MFWRKRNEPHVQETLCSAYVSEFERQQSVLMEAIQDTFRVVDWLVREEGAGESQAHDEARELLGHDIYDRIVAGLGEADMEAVSDAVDHCIARLLASFHRDVLYQHAVQTACRRHKLDDATAIWADQDDQDAVQGRLFCTLREFATPGAWGYVIDSGVADFGEQSPFVLQLQTVRDEGGLPSLAER